MVMINMGDGYGSTKDILFKYFRFTENYSQKEYM